MSDRNGEWRTENEEWMLRALVTLLFVVNSPLSILHSPLTAAAQQPPAVSPQEVPSPVAVRDLTPRFDNLSLEDGLSQSTIHNIVQDRSGFMWFSTQAGLNRWDGYEMKVYEHEPFVEGTLTDSWVWGITESRGGDLLVGTRSGGLNVLDPVTDRVTAYRHRSDDPSSLSSDNVIQAVEDSDGIIWVTTLGGGLNRMNPDTPGAFIHYRYDETDNTSINADLVYRTFEDMSGRIWFGTNNGIARLDIGKTGTFERFLESDSSPWGIGAEPGFETRGFVERPEEPGILWVGTELGLVRVDATTGETDQYTPYPDQPQLNTVVSPSQDPLNPSILWVPTYGGGLSRFDIRSRRFTNHKSDPSNPNGLSDNFLFDATPDRSGMVWVGTELFGLDRFNPASVGFVHYRSDPFDSSSLPGTNVWDIEQMRDGSLWITTSGNEGDALTHMQREPRAAKHYRHNPADSKSVDRGGYLALHEDKAGTLWIGTDVGLDWFDSNSETFYHYREGTDDPTGLAGTGGVWALEEDHAGNLWIGGVNTIARLGPDRSGKFQNYPIVIPGATEGARAAVLDIEEDPAGFIWLGLRGGLARLDPSTGGTTFYMHDPDDPESLSHPWAQSAVVRDREPGIVWVATSGGGLGRLDAQTGKFRNWFARDGLADNTAYAMVEDREGRLWISTGHGLSRFDPETETFRNYGLEIGLQSLEFSQGAAHVGDFGEMFFGGTNGFNAFFPNELSENITPPDVALTDLKLFNRSITETGEIELDGPLNEIEEIRLDYTQRDITFDFVALHYADSENNEFAYILEGFNDDWVAAGRQRSAPYTNLPPGNYTFRVKAANSDGVWNEDGKAISVIITPPFWATWWFRIGGVLLLGFAVFGAFRFRVQQIADRNRELESQVTARTLALKESNEQLEQSQTIVQAINQETSFRRLLTKILEESTVMSGVEKATALVYLPDGFFHVRASSGWDAAQMQHIRLSPSEANNRYVDQAEEVAHDIFVAKNVSQREGAAQLAEFGNVASFLVLRVRVEGQVAGYLVFDNLTSPEAFDQRDVALLERLREHIESAFIKTRILEDLQNTLDDLRSTQDRLVQSEKMASLGQLTAGIAHEIKNPLNFVNNFSDVTKELADEIASEIESYRDQLPESLLSELDSMLENLKLNSAKIGEHGKRADAIVQNMLEHSKAGEGQRQATDVNALLEEYVTLARHGLKSQEGDLEIRVEQNYDDAVGRIDLLPQEMGRVFMNLIGNAFDALKELGVGSRQDGAAPTVTVSTAKSTGPDGAGVEIRISDNGPGIPESSKRKIFEPFYTTKPTGSGTGLGLSMSYDIVTKGHGGELSVESEPGEGATFIVRLPA